MKGVPAFVRRPLPALALAVLTLTGCISAGKRTDYSYNPEYGVESAEFLRSLEALRSGMEPGNRVWLLENGAGLVPSLLDSIGDAQRSINLEIYIFSDGTFGRAVAAALAERARSGVAVRVLVDAVGDRLGGLADEMTAAGVNFRVYKPVRLFSLFHIGHRTHRKILTVDGVIGYCGGFGIDDRWLGDARNEHEWRDLAIRAEGPVVRQLQRIFMEDWVHTTGEVLNGDAQFPAIAPAGDVLAQAVSSSRTDQSSISKLMFYMAIQAARERIWIENAYFVPDAQIRRALIRAAQRGVDVRIVVPGPTIDLPPIRRASRLHYGELLAAGVEIAEFQPTMLHTKAMVVDGIWTTIGSTNLDARSMRKNAEANLVVYDRAFAAVVEQAVTRDLGRSATLTWKAWKRRGTWERVRELFASLFAEAY
ncbi:MAG: phospholipase D-like domain-containing protein [Acidobacteriota bacterium]